MTNTNSLKQIINAFPQCRILLIGDFAADCYQYGRSSRLSREAPVIILQKTGDSVSPGQAGNVAMNLAALGAKPICVGLLGDDNAGSALLEQLTKHGSDVKAIAQTPGRKTVTKTRIYAGGHHAARQQICRIDDDLNVEPASDNELATALENIEQLAKQCHAILVSEYGYGFINNQLWLSLKQIAEQNKIPLVVDSRYDLQCFTGATAITPNEEEAYQLAGLELHSKPSRETLGASLLTKTQASGVILTRGNEGMLVVQPDKPIEEIPIFGSDDVVDVTGAGDTVVATVSLALAGRATLTQAAQIANYAGGLVVMKPGTAVITNTELQTALQE